MAKKFEDISVKLEMQALARRLGAYGFCKKVTKKMTGLSSDFISQVFVPQPIQKRYGVGWLEKKGGEKTNADRILRFLLKAHGDDLSTLEIHNPEVLLKLYESYISNNVNGHEELNRFYYFALELASSVHPVMKCSTCKKPYITLDARVKSCGVCHDIEDRIKHMERVKERRARREAEMKHAATG